MSTSTQINKTGHRKKVDNYHQALKKVIDKIPSESELPKQLRKYFDQDKLPFREPAALKPIREAWEEARCAGIAAGLYQDLNKSEFRVFVSEIVYDDVRRRHYRQTLNGRLGCASNEGVCPMSTIELAQRYEYYRYKKDRKHRGLGQGPIFRAWINEVGPEIQNPFARR